MYKLSLYASIALMVSTISCKNEHTDEADSSSHQKHWSYEGETSPEHWAAIEKNSYCSGTQQSPINIIKINTVPKRKGINDLQIFYPNTTILNKVKNNGHSVQFDFDKGDSIRYHKKIYRLIQIHFHEPSEHTINGIRYPIEIHLVHQNDEKDYTVLSILGEEGEDCEIFEQLERFLPLHEGEEKIIQQAFDLTTLFPIDKEFYSYHGSLTTPPCTENVEWVIYKQPIILSLKEVLKLRHNMPIRNYRNEQPLNGRKVFLNLME